MKFQNAKTLKAVREFPRFQIRDHQMGDLLEATQAPKQNARTSSRNEAIAEGIRVS